MSPKKNENVIKTLFQLTSMNGVEGFSYLIYNVTNALNLTNDEKKAPTATAILVYRWLLNRFIICKRIRYTHTRYIFRNQIVNLLNKNS